MVCTIDKLVPLLHTCWAESCEKPKGTQCLNLMGSEPKPVGRDQVLYPVISSSKQRHTAMLDNYLHI